jgi:putative ABC transport system permease protein
MKQYANHLAFAFRIMARTPVITGLSILVLSISIAQVTIMFNMTESVVFAQLPYEGSERLVVVERQNPSNTFADRGMPFETFHHFLERQQVFEGVAGMFNDGVNLQVGLNMGQEAGIFVSPGFMEMLGVQPIMGRSLLPEDVPAESPPVMVIGASVWKKYFAEDPDVIGTVAVADGVSRTIVGVAPEGFDFPFVNTIWLPLNTDTLKETIGWGSSVFVVAKTRPEVNRIAASNHVSELFASIKSELPVENEGFEGMRIRPFKDIFINDETKMLFLAMGLCAGLILFMGCAIVSNLITVRSVKRSSELAIRSALGASRRQIVMQMLFESMITCMVSLVFGWLLMQWFSLSVLGHYYNQFQVPSWFFATELNPRHYLFVVSVLVFATFASTIVPALRASRTSLNDLLKDSSRTGSSLKITILGRLLIIFQIAAACAVVTGGGIVGYFLYRVALDDTDYNPDQFLYASVGMDNKSHNETMARVRLLKALKASMEAHPEVIGVTYSTQFYAGGLISALRHPDVDYASPDQYPKFYRWVVSPDYFEVMGYSLIQGRGFEEFDDADHPFVVIITDLLARELFGNENPIGKQLIYGGDEERVATVIGVVGDIFRSELDRDRRSGFLLSSYQEVWYDFGVHIHTVGNPRNVEPVLVRSLADIDSNATINNVGTIREQYERNLVGLRLVFVLFLTFSAGALVMAASGLYGVVSFSVSQRIREIGIRLALGAAPLQMVCRVFRQGLGNVAIGMGLGVLGALGLRYMLAFVLNPLQESIVVYAFVLLSIFTVSSIAILVPAIKGGFTDPAEALRID